MWRDGRMVSGKRTTKRGRGRPSKVGKHRAFSLRLPADLHQQLRHYSIDQRVPLNDMIVRAVEDWWSRVPDRKTYVRLVEKPKG
jgi:hypothetical protein